MITVSNCTIRYPEILAVDNFSVSLDNGKIYGLVGPNGAGKTTFLNCVAGSYKPTRGKVFLEGEETTGASADTMCQKGLSRTFQIPRPFSILGTWINANYSEHRKNNL